MLNNINCLLGNLTNFTDFSEYSSVLDGSGYDTLAWVGGALALFCVSKAIVSCLRPGRVTQMASVTQGIDRERLEQDEKYEKELGKKLANPETLGEYLQISPEAIDGEGRLILEKLEDAELARIVRETVNEPKRFLQTEVEGSWISFLGFKECNCSTSSNFDRRLSNRRQELENAIVSHFQKNYHTSDRISLYGFGSGGLLQDYIILGKLFQAGFTNIEIDLIDPGYGSERTERGIFFLELFRRIAPGIQIQFYGNIQDVPSGKTYDVVTAIDCDDLGGDEDDTLGGLEVWEDLLKVKTMLRPMGRLYLGFDLEDVIWQENGKIIPMEHQKGKCHAFYHDMKKRPFSNDSVSITVQDYSFLFPVLGMISALVEKGVTKINFTVLGKLPPWFERVIKGTLPEGVQFNLQSSSVGKGSCDFFIGNDASPVQAALRSMRDRLFRKQRVDYLQGEWECEPGITTRVTHAISFRIYSQGKAETLMIDLQPDVQIERIMFKEAVSEENFILRWAIRAVYFASYMYFLVKRPVSPPSLFST